MSASHQHEWHFDDSYPVLDTAPPIYVVKCGCGALAKQIDGEDDVFDVVTPHKIILNQPKNCIPGSDGSTR